MASGAKPSKTFLANLGDFLKNSGQKGVGVRPLRPASGSAPDPYNLLGFTVPLLSAGGSSRFAAHTL